MKKAADSKANLTDLLDQFDYQPELTARLDRVGVIPFSQAVINEVVLWKVNRYAQVSPAALAAINSVVSLPRGRHRDAEPVLRELLAQRGIDLPMASTFLRFRNPDTFQIIDRRAYRALYGVPYPLRPGSAMTRKPQVYFDYLDALLKFSGERGVDFRILDRVLYVLDKKLNKRRPL